MTVVSSKEFATHQDKYFDLAQDEEICIERGVNMFYLIYRPVEKPIIFEPDNELRSCMTMDEFRAKTHEIIDKFFDNK